MSLVSRLTAKLADPRWKTSLAAGFSAALLWYFLLEKLSQGKTVTTAAVPGLLANPLLPACGIFLLSALSFHLLRPIATKNGSPVAETHPQHSTLTLNVQLLIGLYDENIFSASDLLLYSLPEVLLRTACNDVELLANEQADALLTAQRFHKTQLHYRQCDTADIQQHLVLLKNTLRDIRMQSKPSEVYLFQGVLETSDKNGGPMVPAEGTISVSSSQAPPPASSRKSKRQCAKRPGRVLGGTWVRRSPIRSLVADDRVVRMMRRNWRSMLGQS